MTTKHHNNFAHLLEKRDTQARLGMIPYGHLLGGHTEHRTPIAQAIIDAGKNAHRAPEAAR